MRRAGLFVALAALAAACSGGDSPEQQAAQAALSYYQLLVKGETAEFVEGRAGIDTLSADLRQRLMKSHERYLADIHAKHGGLQAVALSDNAPCRDSLTVAGRQPEVFYRTFLLLSFNDSTQEEIVVPMVEQQGEWKMR